MSIMMEKLKVIIGQRIKNQHDLKMHEVYLALEEAYCAGEMQGIITAQNNEEHANSSRKNYKDYMDEENATTDRDNK